MGPPHLIRLVLLTATLGALPPGAATPAPLSAQIQTDTSTVQHIRQDISERWIHEGQPAEFVRFDGHTRAFELREVRRGNRAGDRHWAVTSNRRVASVALNSQGQIQFLSVELPDLRYSSVRAQSPDLINLVSHFQGLGEVLRLPSTALRELWIVLPQIPLEPGLTWTDTLRFVDEPALGLRESYHAVRTHRVVGDTLVDGRALPRIRTEAEVRYESSLLDYLLYHTRRTTRSLAGHLVGAMVVDTATGLQIAGADTARWQGTAILHDTVSGPYESGVRFERTRAWSWYDSAAHQAFADSAQDARRRRSTGMLIIATDPVAERLAAGDSALADSLLARWPLARDPDEILRIQRLLRTSRNGLAWALRLDSLALVYALARGDTAAAIGVARGYIPHQNPREQLTRTQAEFLLPYLDDPARRWRLGVPERFDYLSLMQTLLRASPLLEADTSRWGCRPEACELFLAQLEQASEPRLRDAALVGRFARDPARWHDRLLERHEAGSPLTAEALRMARGMPEHDSPPLPAADAGWQAWRAWWSTRPPARDDRRYALRLHAALTGRDPVAELAAAWPPEGDSAQAVVGEILREFGALPDPTVEELLASVLSGEPARINQARRYLFAGGAETVPPDEAAGFLAPLMDSLLAAGDAPWPAAPGALPEGQRRIYPVASSSHGVEGVARFVMTEHIPEGVLERLPPDVQAISQEAWDERDPRAGGWILRFSPVHRRGPFVRLSWDWVVMERRAPDEAPSGYAGGGSLTLVETEQGWMVVGQGAWIT